MLPKVQDARYIGNLTGHVRFSHGTEGDVDLSEELYAEIFEPYWLLWRATWAESEECAVGADWSNHRYTTLTQC